MIATRINKLAEAIQDERSHEHIMNELYMVYHALNFPTDIKEKLHKLMFGEFIKQSITPEAHTTLRPAKKISAYLENIYKYIKDYETKTGNKGITGREVGEALGMTLTVAYHRLLTLCNHGYLGREKQANPNAGWLYYTINFKE